MVLLQSRKISIVSGSDSFLRRCIGIKLALSGQQFMRAFMVRAVFANQRQMRERGRWREKREGGGRGGATYPITIKPDSQIGPVIIRNFDQSRR